MTVKDFIKELASDSPAPGGGSVACVNGALGAALGAMVSRLTIGKEKYKEVEDLFNKSLKKLDDLHSILTDLIDEDANAFNGVMAAFKMPKNTDDEKKIRSEKIQEEYKKAAEVPMKTVRSCYEVLSILLELGVKGNKNAVSDLAVGALNAAIGIKSAALNVEINLPSIKDDAFKEKMRNELRNILDGLDGKISNLLVLVRNEF